MKKKKSNQKKFKKEDIFGLKSYTDGAKMWKFITSELDPTNTSISFLNDKSFENFDTQKEFNVGFDLETFICTKQWSLL